MDHLKPHTEFYNVPWIAEDFNGMPYRPLGRSGLKVSNVGLGTWKIGYPDTGDGSRVDAKTAMKIFDRALELGVTHWDTANRYNNASGNSERIIGLWFRANPDQRRNVILASKIFGGMDGRSPNHCRLSRTNIVESVYASLKRLQLDYIDILYFHAFDPDTPVEESLETVDDLVRRDLVRHFAVSNFSRDQLESYRRSEERISARSRVLAVQNQFDILNGEAKHAGVLEFCSESGISYVAFSPLARGLLSERYLTPAAVGKGDRLFDEGTLEKDLSPAVVKKLSALDAVGRKWGMGITQLTLAYMLTIPGMGPVIPSSMTVEQLENNAAAGKVRLDDEQKSQLKKILA